jgi:hypothetical protein
MIRFDMAARRPARFKKSWDRIIPFPTGRALIGRVPGNELPGYVHLVPTGQNPTVVRRHSLSHATLSVE